MVTLDNPRTYSLITKELDSMPIGCLMSTRFFYYRIPYTVISPSILKHSTLLALESAVLESVLGRD
jgi:hypothetical protein